MTRTVFWAAVGTAIAKGTGTVLAIKRGYMFDPYLLDTSSLQPKASPAFIVLGTSIPFCTNNWGQLVAAVIPKSIPVLVYWANKR
ncbi:hypothetical protein PY092_16250 [Muricauda sp. 334s03]|nr:hypothetical protein [[Muricauda] yonaguniensis]MDF0717716.1 hypothetical protein [[Muricauda] yonaguniensis]